MNGQPEAIPQRPAEVSERLEIPQAEVDAFYASHIEGVAPAIRSLDEQNARSLARATTIVCGR